MAYGERHSSISTKSSAIFLHIYGSLSVQKWPLHVRVKINDKMNSLSFEKIFIFWFSGPWLVLNTLLFWSHLQNDD